MRKEVMSKAEATVAGIATRYGGSGAITWEPPTPAIINDPALMASLAPVLASASNGNVNDQVDYSPGSEDFAFYGTVFNGLYFAC